MSGRDMKKLVTATVNSATDPAVLMTMGGSVYIMNDSPEAAAINSLTAVMAFAVRGVNELNKAGVEINTPKYMDIVLKNPGGSQIVAGLIKLGAAGSAIPDINPAEPESAFPAAAMAGFGSANLSRGAAFRFEKGSAIKQTLDCAGTLIPSAVYFFSNPDAPTAVDAGFIGGMASSLALTIQNKQAHGFIQPNLILGTTLLTSAMYTNEPLVAAGSVLWGLGYMSQDMLKKQGGVAEVFVNATDQAREAIKNSGDAAYCDVRYCIMSAVGGNNISVPDPDVPGLVHEFPAEAVLEDDSFGKPQEPVI